MKDKIMKKGFLGMTGSSSVDEAEADREADATIAEAISDTSSDSSADSETPVVNEYADEVAKAPERELNHVHTADLLKAAHGHVHDRADNSNRSTRNFDIMTELVSKRLGFDVPKSTVIGFMIDLKQARIMTGTFATTQEEQEDLTAYSAFYAQQLAIEAGQTNETN